MCTNSHAGQLNWDELRSFLAVARMGRLTVAARSLGVDHSTLSRRIQALEARLGLQLFERAPSGYRITPIGEKVMEEVMQMEACATRIQAELSKEARSLDGPIRLSLPEGFSARFLLSRLPALRQSSPGISIELVADPGILSLTRREADIAIMMERPTTGPLISRKLCDYEYGLYGAAEYLERNPPLHRPEDMKAHRLVGYIPDRLPTPAHDYLREMVPGRHADLQISNILAQVDAVCLGLGLGLLPCFIASQYPTLERLLPRGIGFHRSYWLVTHELPRHPSRVNTVKKFITSQVAQAQALFRPPATGDRH